MQIGKKSFVFFILSLIIAFQFYAFFMPHSAVAADDVDEAKNCFRQGKLWNPSTKTCVEDRRYEGGNPITNFIDFVTGGIEKVITAIIYVIGYIASFLFWLGAQIIGFLLSLNAQVLQIPIVTIGWGIVRDIANLGFVLAIIIIAMATITRFESYGAKELLPKLIAAAILVNFSLTIGGVFIDFSNVLSGFFFKKTTGDGSVFGMADEIAGAFDIQKLLQTKSSSEIKGEIKLETTYGAILSLFLAAVFTIVAALTLFGIALMLLVRLIYLAVLLVISPIAWLFWVIPSLEGQFKKWWTSFLHWIFYAPILTFFLYLTLASIDEINEFTNKHRGAGLSVGHGTENLTATEDVFIAIANMVVLVGFLVAGLMTAKSMGMVGAQGMIGIAERAGQGARKWAGKKGKEWGGRAATAPLRTDRGRAFTEKMETLGQNRNPFLRALSRPFRTVGKGLTKGSRAVEEKLQEKGKVLPKTLNDQAKQYSTYSKPQKAQVLQNISKEYETRFVNKASADKELKKTKNNLSEKHEELKSLEKDPNVGVIGSDVNKKYNDAKQEIIKMRSALGEAKKSANKENKNWDQFKTEVLEQLPKTARKDIEEIIKTEDGKFDISKIKWARKFGYSEKTITPAKKRTQKIEELIEDFLKSEKKEEKEKTKEEKK